MASECGAVDVCRYLIARSSISLISSLGNVIGRCSTEMVLLHYQSPLSSISNHQPSSHVLSELDLRSMSSPTTASAHFLQLHSETIFILHICFIDLHFLQLRSETADYCINCTFYICFHFLQLHGETKYIAHMLH